METLKVIGLGTAFIAVLLLAAFVGQSKLPK